MTQNPYAGAGEMSGTVYAEPERTSVMAVLSLVCSLICCIPGFGALGCLLGVGALVGIAGSGGRVGGKGLAIAGLIIGGLITAVQIGMFVVFNAGISTMTRGVDAVMTDLENGDFAAARQGLLSPAADVTDEQMALFVATYQSELGSYQGVPSNLFEYIGDFFEPEVGQHMQSRAGGGNVAPVPVRFANGKTVAMLYFDPNAGPDSVTDLVIVLPDGTDLELSEPEDAAGSQAP